MTIAVRILMLASLTTACETTTPPPAAEGRPATEAPATAPKKTVPTKPEPPKELTLKEVEHAGLGFAITVPTDHELTADDKKAEFKYEMPDRRRLRAKIRKISYELKSIDAVRQHAKDSAFGKVQDATTLESGMHLLVSTPKQVAGKNQQKVRIYSKSMFAECGGLDTELEFNKKVCGSLRKL